MKVAFAITLLFLSASLIAGNTSVYHPVESYPSSVSESCRGGVAQIYDECSSQKDILETALARANKARKTVIVVYGAEWCIWCHVFDKYINGHSRKFKYRWQYHDGDNLKWKMKERENKNAVAEAKQLNKFVADNFVIAHIESYHSPDGFKTASGTGINIDKFDYVPVIFALNNTGKYAGHMLAYDAIPGMEIRQDSGKDFRGFDRNILLSELAVLLRKAHQNRN